MSGVNKDTDFFRIVDSFETYKAIPSTLIQGDLKRAEKCKVSIVIPTYKRPDLLKEAINSVVDQVGYEDYCILIIDNQPCRGCETEKLLATYQDSRILYFKNAENIGMFGNQNRCFELAPTDWVVLLHDDDLLLPTFLQDCMAVIRRNNKIDGLQPKRFVWKDDGRKLNLPEHLKDHHSLRRIYDVSNYVGFQAGTPSGGIFKRKMVLKLGGYNPEFHPTSDFCFSVLFSQYFHLYIFSKTLSVYRILANESLKTETLSLFVLNDYYLKGQILNKYKVPRWISEILLDYCGRRQVGILNQNFNLNFNLEDVNLSFRKINKLTYYVVRLFILLYTRVVCFFTEFRLNRRPEKLYL